MARQKQIPLRWSLRGCPMDGELGTSEPSYLVVPSIPQSSLTPLLSGLLPNRGHNDDLAQRLQLLPPAGAAAQPIFSVFAADPFIEGKQIAQRLLEKGYKRIVNWPTTAQYGADFCAQLDSVNVGPKQEYENLLRFANRGLSISLAVCGAEAAAEFGRLQPEIVFLAPTFDLWSNGRMRSRELLRRCAVLSGVVQGAIPIVLMAACGAVSVAQARKAGATALLSA
jgi:predicted TIM-barrel enzyme